MINVISIVKKETQMMSAGLRRCYVINFHFYVYRVDSIENHLLLSDKIINFRFFSNLVRVLLLKYFFINCKHIHRKLPI